MSPSQKEFNDTYMTSREICEMVGVTRVAVLQARKRNLLPDPIELEGLTTIWKRASIMPYVQKWIETRRARVGL